MLNPKRNCKAIVIGINSYTNLSKEKQLQGAENDAKEIADLLEKNGYFKVERLIGSVATEEQIRKSISKIFFKEAEPYEIIIFYFAGHGVTDGYGNGYIAPSDMIADEPFVHGINMDLLDETIQKYYKMYGRNNNTAAAVILDCCYAGKISRTRSTTSSKDDFDFIVQHLVGKGNFIFHLVPILRNRKKFLIGLMIIMVKRIHMEHFPTFL